MATTFTRAKTRDSLLSSVEEGERAWRADRESMDAHRKKAGKVAVALATVAASVSLVYGYLTLLADSGVRAMIAVERELLDPEGVRASDPTAALDQFAELDTRKAFVGGDKADQEPVISPEPDIPNTPFPESDL
jgi:hypothetical protein